MSSLVRLVRPLGILSALPFLVASIAAQPAVPERLAMERLADSLTTEYEAISTVTAPFDTTSSLDDYLAIAAVQSPALRRAFYRWKAAFEKAGYAGALPDPIFSFGHFIESVETRVGPQERRYSLKQSFPWFGTLGAKRDIALEQAGAAFRQYESEKSILFYTVKSAYYDYYYLGRDIDLTAENLQLLEFWESIVRTKYKLALKQHPDVIKAQVELGRLEDRLLTLRDNVKPAAARLRAVLNVPDEVELPIPRSIAIEEISLARDSILGAALENNPDLRVFNHLIDRERTGVRLARKVSLPNFTVGVDYIETGQAVNPAVTGSGKDSWVFGVGVSLPIWFGKNGAKKREAEAKLRAAEYDYADAQNRLKAFVEKLLFEYSDALRKTSLYRDGLVPKAEQALNANYTAYKAGETDFLNVLDAQRQLLALQLNYEGALSDLATYRAEIEMVTGRGLAN